MTNFFQKTTSLSSYIRGFLYNYLLLGGKSKALSFGSNSKFWGQIVIGENVKIGSNVSIFKKSLIFDNVTIGDNVELRSNRGNQIIVGKNCTINRGSVIIGQVTIGDNCLIAPLCVVVGSNHIFSNLDVLIRNQGIHSKGIIIQNNVWLGAKVTILDGVTIGANSVIGAGSVVTKNIPNNSIAVGNPCRVVKSRG